MPNRSRNTSVITIEGKGFEGNVKKKKWNKLKYIY